MDATEPESEHTESGQSTITADEVERLRRELDDQRQRQLRLLADFENFRRGGRDQEVARREGARSALLPLLSVLDTLERALAAGSIDPDFYEGVAATHRLFVNACGRRERIRFRAWGGRSTRRCTRPSPPWPRTGCRRARWRARCGAAGGSATSCSAGPGRGREVPGGRRPWP